MKNYETTIVLKPTLEIKEVKKVVQKVVSAIKEEKGKIVHQSNNELRSFSYPIQKHNKGFYQTIEFESGPNFIEKLEILYKREENILRFLTIALDKHGIKYNEEKRLSQKEKRQKVEQEMQEQSEQNNLEEKA